MVECALDEAIWIEPLVPVSLPPLVMVTEPPLLVAELPALREIPDPAPVDDDPAVN